MTIGSKYTLVPVRYNSNISLFAITKSLVGLALSYQKSWFYRCKSFSMTFILTFFQYQLHCSFQKFVKTDEFTFITLTSTTINHPNSVVYIRVSFWFCIFHEFGQMFNDMYLHYSSIQSIFTKNSLCSDNSLFPSPFPATTSYFTVFIVVPFWDAFSIMLDSCRI